MSDAELIARTLLEEDPEAFGELVRRYQGGLRAWLRKLTNDDHARADDLAQETFLRAFRHLASFRGDGQFAAWLNRIAYNLFRSEMRRRQPEYVPAEELEAIDPHAPDPRQDGSGDLDQALSRLSPEERSALILCYQQEYTQVEAAEIMGCPPGTLKTYLARGKQKLRRHLSARPTRC